MIQLGKLSKHISFICVFITVYRVAKYKCRICSFVGLDLTFSKTHCELEHPGAVDVTSDLVRSVTEEDLGATEDNLEVETKSKPSTPHTYQNWLKDIRSNYKNLVVSKCSQQTREAVANNEKIKVASSFAGKLLLNKIFYFYRILKGRNT